MTLQAEVDDIIERNRERLCCNSIPFLTSMTNLKNSFIVNNIQIIYTDYLLFSK